MNLIRDWGGAVQYETKYPILFLRMPALNEKYSFS